MAVVCRASSSIFLGVLTLACGEARPMSGELGPELPYRNEHLRVLPLPSDVMTEPADTPTGRRLVVADEKYNLGDADEALFALGPDFVGPLASLDGWSTTAAVFVPTGHPVDPASLAEHVAVIDLDARARVETELGTFDGTTDYGKAVSWISAKPVRPLAPNTRHAIVLLRGLSTIEGEDFARSPEFESAVADPSFTRLQGLREAFQSLGMDDRDLLVADTFTTQSIDEGIDSALALVRAQDAPSVQLVATATESSYRVFRGLVDFPVLEEAPGAEPRVESWESVELLVTIPTGTGPFPIVVFQHGLSNRKELVFSDDFAEELSARGLATVGFDAPLHGYRNIQGGDPGLRFIDIAQPANIPDNFRHAAFDHAFLAANLEALGRSELDTSRVAYFGISLGAIIGGIVVGLEPRVEAAALVVGGGALSEFINRYVEGLGFSPFPSVMIGSGMQAVVDRGDPTNFARRASNKQVLLVQAMQDETIPKKASIALGRALGLPIVGEAVELPSSVEVVPSPHERRGWTQYDPGTHNLIGRDDESAMRARAQLFHFLESWAETGTAEIR